MNQANKFLELREREGYYYFHITRTNGRLIAVIPYMNIGSMQQYLARVEVCPAHRLSPDLYSITGGVDSGETAQEAAKRELLEEAGYSIHIDELQHLGCVRPSKQSDTQVDLFAVDVSGKPQGVIKGDGSKWEQGASAQWVSYEDGLQIVDPLFVTGMIRVREQVWLSKQSS